MLCPYPISLSLQILLNEFLKVTILSHLGGVKVGKDLESL